MSSEYYKDENKNMREELHEAASLEGSELGEYWYWISTCPSSIEYCSSKEFKDALFKEIKEQYDYLKSEFKIVEEEITTTRKYTELKFRDE